MTMVHKYALLPNEKKGYASTLGRYTFCLGWVSSLYWTVCLDQNNNRYVNGVHLHKRGSITSRKFT